MRRRLLLLLPFLLLLTTAAVGATAEPKVKVSAVAGFDGRAGLERWAPVSVELTNQGASVSGRLVARQSRGAGVSSAEYSMALTLPEGGRKKVNLSIPAYTGAGGVEVSFVAGSQTLASQVASLSVGGPDDLLVGVLSREPVALAGLAQVRLAGRTGNVRLVRLAAEALPENLTLLANFDVLALARFDSASLSPAQKQALSDWVSRGGLLVLVGGPDWRSTLGGLPDELLPVQAFGTRTVEKLPVMEALGAQELKASGSGITLTTSDLKGARTLAIDGTDPVVAVGRHGRGTVLFFAVDLTMEPFSSWMGEATMWETMLLQHLGGGFWTSGGSSTGNPVLMARALSSQPMLTAPDLRRLAIGMMMYALLIGPVGYGLLVLIRRRVIFWVLVPVAAVAALGGLYYQGFVREGRAVMTRLVSVTEVAPGMATIPSRTYMAVMAPSRTNLKVSLSADDLAAPFLISDAGDATPAVTKVSLDNPPSVELAGLNMWNLRGLVVDREVPGLEGLALDFSLQGNRLVGRITNGMGKSIRDGLVITPSGFERLPEELKPGASAPIDSSLSFYRRPWQPVFQEFISGGTSARDQREQLFRRYVLEAAVGATRDALPAPLLFLGWLDEAPSPLAAMGREVAGNHLIYAPIIPTVDPLDYNLEPGLIMGRLVAAEGQQRGRSPRGYFVQEGALTFSLKVPEVDLSVLDQVRLAVETGGAQDEVKLKLLNWQTGQWDEWPFNQPVDDLQRWHQVIARDGSLLVRVEVGKDGQEVRVPSISLRGRR